MTRRSIRPAPLLLSAAAAAVLLCAIPSRAWACTACQCGTTTVVAAQGTTGASADAGWIVELEGRGQSVAMGDTSTTGLRIMDLRTELGVSARVVGGLRLGVAMPWVYREATWSNGQAHRAAGPGDLSAQAAWVQGLGTRGVVANAWAGVRAPTAPEQRDVDGRVLDHDAQTGTGSWIPMVGAGVAQTVDAWVWRVDASVAFPGESRWDFRPSNAVLGTLAAGRDVGAGLLPMLRVDTRWEAGRMLADGPDPNSGGTVVFVSPELQWAWNDTLFVVAAVRVPVVRAFTGLQEESPIGSLRLLWRPGSTAPRPVDAPWGPMAAADPSTSL